MVKKSYKLPEQTLSGIDYSHHLDDMKNFRSFTENLAIRTVNTRIERYILYLEEIVDEKVPDESKIFKSSLGSPFERPIDRLLYILREVHELTWIIRGLNQHQPKGIKEKLARIVGGRDFAALDLNASSRNAQFELRIASYFCQEGYQVDLTKDTDIVAMKLRNIYFVECKRVASKKKLDIRIKDAQKQLISRMPKNTWNKKYFGLVAVDVTKVAFSHNGLTLGQTSEHTKDIIQDKLKEISDKIEIGRFFTKKNKILLLWLQIHIPALVIHPYQCTTRFSSNFIVTPYLFLKNMKGFKNLQHVLHRGDILDPRSAPPEKLFIRKSLTFPKGTTMKCDEDLLLNFLNTWKLDHREPEDIVLTLVIDSKKDEFTYYDLQMFIPKLVETDKARLQNDLALAKFEFAAELYLQRYPYE